MTNRPYLDLQILERGEAQYPSVEWFDLDLVLVSKGKEKGEFMVKDI